MLRCSASIQQMQTGLEETADRAPGFVTLAALCGVGLLALVAVFALTMNPAMLVAASVVALAALYFALAGGRRLHRHVPGAVSGKGLFTWVIDHLFGLAGRITVRLENGSLQRYAVWMVALAIGLAAWPFVVGPAPGRCITASSRCCSATSGKPATAPGILRM